MDSVSAIILGFVQGLTEFIPVSSSGHLIVARSILHLEDVNALSVDAVFQLATVLAVGVYFFRDLLGVFKNRTLFLAIALGTVPAVIAGLLLEHKMDTVFRSVHLVAWTLLAGALLMYIAERFGKQDAEVTPKRGLIIGLFQALALVPGISRSGATISGGLFVGLTRESAARFSFLLSFPIIFGSGLKKLWDLHQTSGLLSIGAPLWLGSATAFVVGLCAIHFLIQYLKNHKLTVFIWYRVILAVLIFAFF